MEGAPAKDKCKKVCHSFSSALCRFHEGVDPSSVPFALSKKPRTCIPPHFLPYDLSYISMSMTNYIQEAPIAL